MTLIIYFTSKASLALLTGGESIVNDLLNSKDHYFKDINKYSDNLYSLLAKNYSLNVISSYDYCYYHSKYLDKGKLDASLWPNALQLKESLDKLLEEHKEYVVHMEHHH